MKNAKTYILIGVLVLVLGAAVYFNFALSANPKGSDKQKEQTEETAMNSDEMPVISTGDYLENYKENREAVREKEVAYLDSIIENEKTDSDTLAEAQAAKIETVRSMEKELIVEGLLSAKGFDNSIVTVHTGSVNVVVREKEINETQAAQILDIVQKETKENAKNIKIILQG